MWWMATHNIPLRRNDKTTLSSSIHMHEEAHANVGTACLSHTNNNNNIRPVYDKWTDGPFVGQTTQSAPAAVIWERESQAGHGWFYAESSVIASTYEGLRRRQLAEAIMRPGCWASKFYWTVTFSLLTPFMYTPRTILSVQESPENSIVFN